MQYPSTEAIESASRYQLATWTRFLPSPGYIYIGGDLFEEKLEEEAKKMDRILVRFWGLGGWSPELSKQIGWG